MSSAQTIPLRPLRSPRHLPLHNQRTRRAPTVSRLFLVISFVYILLCTLDVVSFTIWPSVKEYLGELDPYLYFEKTWEDNLLAPWGIRTGVAMPALLLAEVTPLTQDQAFGLYCGILLMTTTMLINRTAVAGLQTKLHKHELAVTCVIYTLGYLMNGRLCPAFLGSAILMRAHVFWCRGLMTTPRVLIHNFFALPLMTVSSGTFIVGFATILAWLTMAVCDLRMANHRIRLRPLILLGMIPVVFLAGVQGSLFVTKLHDYYQGDMIQVLYHGYGDLLQRYMPGLTLGELTAVMSATVPALILIIAATLRQFSWTHVYLLVSTCLTVLMGACGYSTMLTNTPTVVLCGALILARQAIPPQQITLKAAA